MSKDAIEKAEKKARKEKKRQEAEAAAAAAVVLPIDSSLAEKEDVDMAEATVVQVVEKVSQSTRVFVIMSS